MRDLPLTCGKSPHVQLLALLFFFFLNCAFKIRVFKIHIAFQFLLYSFLNPCKIINKFSALSRGGDLPPVRSVISEYMVILDSCKIQHFTNIVSERTYIKMYFEKSLGQNIFGFPFQVEIMNSLSKQNLALCVRTLLAVGIKVNLLAFFGAYSRMLYFFTTVKWIL